MGTTWADGSSAGNTSDSCDASRARHGEVETHLSSQTDDVL